ncbi:MAG: hypothetical protein ACKVVT_15460 [Dehalococcoidia bacterium]
MTEEIPPWPHKPAPPERRRIVPPWPLLWRGAALLLMAATGAHFAVRPLLAGRWWSLVATPVGGVVTVLSLWAALVHLTGGEKFDDHEFV